MKMTLVAMALLSGQTFAASDLTLPGERWLGKANGLVCANDTTKKVEGAATLDRFAVAFETVTTDFSLDNGLLKATFVENGVSCRYSALILADNTAKTLTLVESRAYAPDTEASCEAGQAQLDALLQANTYLYWGRPHHLTILIEDPAAATVCGEGETTVGVDFVLAGRVN